MAQERLKRLHKGLMDELAHLEERVHIQWRARRHPDDVMLRRRDRVVEALERLEKEMGLARCANCGRREPECNESVHPNAESCAEGFA